MGYIEVGAKTRTEFWFFKALGNHSLLWNCVVRQTTLTFSEIPLSWKLSPQLYDLNTEAYTGAHTAQGEGKLVFQDASFGIHRQRRLQPHFFQICELCPPQAPGRARDSPPAPVCPTSSPWPSASCLLVNQGEGLPCILGPKQKDQRDG